MKYINQFGFKGYYPDLPSDLAPDGALVYPSKNFKVKYGVLESIPGYSKLQSAPLRGLPLLLYRYRALDSTETLLAFTSTDIYRWDDVGTVFKYLTPRYNTGTAYSNGTYVTGIGTVWNTNIKADDEIGFGDTDPDNITTWYSVSSITDDTHLVLGTGVTIGTAEVTNVTCPADSSGSLGGTYWTLTGMNSSGDPVDYYVWYDTGSSTDPAPAGKTGIHVIIVSDDTAAVVATKTASAIDALANFSCPAPAADTITITNNYVGPVTDAANYNTGVTVSVTTQGAAVSYVVRKLYTASTYYRWEAETIYDGVYDKNIVVATNGHDYPVRWDGDILNYFEDLAGNPPRAKHISKAFGMLILSNISVVQTGGTGTATPYTMIWSDVANTEVWDGTGASGYQELYYTMGEIQFIARFRDGIVIARTDEIDVAYPTGVYTSPFTFNRVVRNRGSITSAWCYINGFIGLITDNDICMFDGTQQLKSIANGKIRYAFFSDFDFNQAYLVHSVYSERYHEWRIFIPSGSNYPNKCWVYSIDYNEWFYEEKEAVGSGAYNYKTSITWDAATGTWDAATGTWNSASSSRAYNDVAWGDSNGYIYLENPDLKTADGADIDCVIATKDYGGDEIDDYCRFLNTYVHYEGSPDANDIIQVTISTNQGINTETPQNITGGTTGRLRKVLGWNSVGRTCRVVFSGRYFNIYGFKLAFEPQGLR